MRRLVTHHRSQWFKRSQEVPPASSRGFTGPPVFFLRTPFTEGCAGANKKASPPGRHQEQASKQRCTFRPTTFSSVQFSSVQYRARPVSGVNHTPPPPPWPTGKHLKLGPLRSVQFSRKRKASQFLLFCTCRQSWWGFSSCCYLPAVGPGGLRWGFFFFGWDSWLIGLRFVFGAWGGSLGASVQFSSSTFKVHL